MPLFVPRIHCVLKISLGGGGDRGGMHWLSGWLYGVENFAVAEHIFSRMSSLVSTIRTDMREYAVWGGMRYEGVHPRPAWIYESNCVQNQTEFKFNWADPSEKTAPACTNIIQFSPKICIPSTHRDPVLDEGKKEEGEGALKSEKGGIRIQSKNGDEFRG